MPKRTRVEDEESRCAIWMKEIIEYIKDENIIAIKQNLVAIDSDEIEPSDKNFFVYLSKAIGMAIYRQDLESFDLLLQQKNITRNFFSETENNKGYYATLTLHGDQRMAKYTGLKIHGNREIAKEMFIRLVNAGWRLESKNIEGMLRCLEIEPNQVPELLYQLNLLNSVKEKNVEMLKEHLTHIDLIRKDNPNFFVDFRDAIVAAIKNKNLKMVNLLLRGIDPALKKDFLNKASNSQKWIKAILWIYKHDIPFGAKLAKLVDEMNWDDLRDAWNSVVRKILTCLVNAGWDLEIKVGNKSPLEELLEGFTDKDKPILVEITTPIKQEIVDIANNKEKRENSARWFAIFSEYNKSFAKEINEEQNAIHRELYIQWRNKVRSYEGDKKKTMGDLLDEISALPNEIQLNIASFMGGYVPTEENIEEQKKSILNTLK